MKMDNYTNRINLATGYYFRKTAYLVMASIILASYPVITEGQDGFENGADDIVVALEPPSFLGVAGLTVHAGSYAMGATMHVSGMASLANASIYPERVSLGINGTEIWGFKGLACGQLGKQDMFFNGRTTADLEFGKDGGSSETRVRLPKNAIVQNAVMSISSCPKLIGQELVNFSGDLQNKSLGQSLTGAGDVNGDGYDDIIIGLSTKVNIYYGGPVMNQTPDVVLTQEKKGDSFGTAVSGAGDVNNDGYDDVVVGASKYDSDNFVRGIGKAYLFLGGPSFDNRPDWAYAGAAEYDGLGATVASAGDVNGDGYGDFMIGQQSKDTVLIIHGGPDPNNLIILNISGPGPSFGASISGAGDMNNDGYDDVVISNPLKLVSVDYEGEVYVLFGAKDMDPWIDLTYGSSSRYELLGKSVSGAGDMNGDGYDDIIVMAVQNNGSMPGAAHILLGGPVVDNIPDFNFTGIYTMTGASPQSVACVGDVNGDGFEDALVGAYFESSPGSEAGAAYLYYGGTSMDSKADWSFKGAAAGDHFGYAVAGAGDANGDGFDDFIISAPGNDSSVQDTGRVYVATLVNTTFRGPVNSSLNIGTTPLWKYPGVFNFGTSVTMGNHADEFNQFLRATASSGSDDYGNEYVDVPLVAYSMTEGALKLSDMGIVYECDFKVGDFAAPLNRYLKDNQGAKTPEGNILVPINISSTSAGRVKLSGLNITLDIPPIQVRALDGLALDEDTATVDLVDLRDYFEDDVDSPANLTFSIVSATNGTYARLWITANRYLSADVMTGDANDNWTGTVEMVVACEDQWGQRTESRPFTLLIRNVNDAPFITSEPVLSAKTGVHYFYNVTAVDGDNDPMSYSLPESPANMSIDPSSGRITWLPDKKGFYRIIMAASDGKLSGSQSFEISVPNSPPRVKGDSVPEALVGVPWNITIGVIDDDGDPLTFALVSQIDGMTVNTSTGVLRWTPSTAGNYTVIVGISDGELNITYALGLVVTQGNRAPSFTSEPVRNATMGVPFVYNVRAEDPDADTVVLSVVSGPPGMTIDGFTGRLGWTPVALGNITVKLLASDGKGGEAFQEFDIKVVQKVLPRINITTPSEGQKVRGKISVGGTVSKGTLDVMKVQVRVDSSDWMDASGNTTWHSMLDSSTLKRGRHELQARAYDGQNYTDPVNRTIFVDNPVSGSEGLNIWQGAAIILVAVTIAASLIGRRFLQARK